MSGLQPDEIQAIIERVRRRVGDDGEPDGARLRGEQALEASPGVSAGGGVHAGVQDALSAAGRAFAAFDGAGLEARKRIISSVRQAMLEHGDRLAEMAQAETGLGRADDKTRKNRLVTTRTPGPEDLELDAETGDRGMNVTEFAPFGIVAAITPTTNPTSTVINNTIAIVSAGNAVVFNVHPNAKQVSAENVRLINEAIMRAGGPPDLVTTIAEPTIESAQEVMNHPDVRLLLVTGGPGVVREALKTDKRAVTAGPGNPPAVVDETADIEQAAADIVAGGSFDNNIICTDEKTTIAVDSIADPLVRAMERSGAYVLAEHELRRLERVIFRELGEPNKPGRINPQWVGQDVQAILAEIGVRVGPEVRMAVARVPNEHSLVWTEQMMPVMPVTSVRDVDQAIDLAVRSEHRFGHTASMHSSDVGRITRMGRAMNCSIFVANGPCYAGLGEGGEGFCSFSIATPTGDGLTRPQTFSRERRMTIVGSLRMV
ncbi:aldehyde dehydrogenase EutE [Egibacter rhizosphaerae]|uniref:Aldehyde dehydrogenase EutE n=1 Tax=Egibacter rhizosphaerae TaxID=1670831 RepID=A0A411YBI2_9ACTN|nr:aldehyde dehydrogenase family protein [Egibacter rhizosphaerae]QBI18613.1 aldehyde dehydrogenase EutE [Egibacter rhizosphaerae]